MSALKYWLWLTELPGLTNQTRLALLRHFPTPEDVYYAEAEEVLLTEGITREQAILLENKNCAAADRILADCQRLNVNILTLQDAGYPNRLRNIYDPPCLLYVRGRLPAFDDEAAVAVVGTRDCTPYGVSCAEKLGHGLAAGGAVVVSGLARGIDSAALRGALRAGGTVAAVLGNGTDVIYPPENQYLYEDVAAAGALVSEYPPGTPPDGRHFPVRNRILSGLSLAALVVEAPERSGALITAGTALEQGRDVFAVPGNIDQPSFVGSNRLLRDGAIMVSSGWDILSEYEALFPDKIRKEDAPAHQTAYPDEVRKAAEAEKPLLKVAQKLRLPRKNENLKKDLAPQGIDKTPCAPYSDVGSVRPKLSPEEQTIVDALSGGQRLVDDVIAETGLSTGKLLSSLTMLELKGIIKRLPGKRIVLSGK